MAEAGVVGLGRLTLSRRERMVVVEPRGTGMALCAIGDGDNDGLQCGSLKNTSQLLLSTGNGNSTVWVGGTLATNVCNQGHFRRHMLTASFTARDPQLQQEVQHLEFVTAAF